MLICKCDYAMFYLAFKITVHVHMFVCALGMHLKFTDVI